MSYAAAFLGDKPIIRSLAGSAGASWVRPTDWTAMPAIGPTEEKFIGLIGVSDDEANFVSLLAITSTGTYTVDWGDGTVDIVTSNTKIDHFYDFSNVALGAAKADGMKQALVTVTATTGNLTGINLQQRYTLAGLAQAFQVNWLEISISSPNLTSMTIGGGTVALAILRKFTLGICNVTSFASLFQDCRALVQVSPLASNSSITNMVSMFQSCISLQSIPPFPGSVAAVTNMVNMFNGCNSLQSIPPFPGSVAAVTTMSGMFANCSSLQSIPPFPGSVAAVTSMQSMFQSCFSLQSIPPFPGSVAAVTSMTNMFVNCSSLQSIPPFPGSVAAVTSMVSMFQSCFSLQSIPPFPGSVAAVTSMTNMFLNCFSLQSIPPFETSGITSDGNAGNMFVNCRSLTKGRTNGITRNISYAQSKLSANELNEIYTGLGTAAVSGVTTLSVSANFGYSASDTSIATAKGWNIN